MLKLIDKYFWWYLSFIILLIILISLFLGNYSDLYDWFYTNAYTDNTNLVTISTVFIAIYFSLYGFLLSSDTNSLVSKLKLKEYKRLVSIVNRGFLSSFIIVIFSFFNENIYNWMGKIYILFLFFIFLLLIGSAIQIAIYFTLLFKYDLNKKYNSFEEDIQKEILDNELREKLKQFLDENL